MDSKIVHGGLTQEAIDKLVKKHGKGNISCVTVGDQHFWFKKPTMQTLRMVTKASGGDPIMGTELYFKNCRILGDEDAIKDADMFASLMEPINNLIEVTEAEVKKF
jgi:hypothetical protein